MDTYSTTTTPSFDVYDDNPRGGHRNKIFDNYMVKFQPRSEPVIFLLRGLVSALLIVSFFLSSIWLYVTIPFALGCIYYLMVESHPQLIFLLNMVIGYHIQRLSQWCKSWLESTKSLFNRNINHRIKLELKNGYSSLAYFDPTLNKQHIFLFKENQRFNDLIIFRDENEVDITDYIEPYLGPLQNFHGIPLVPRDFGHKKIKVFRDGEINLSRTFEEDEVIKF